MPRLNVKAMAELLTLPAYEQLRVLHDQKYPKQQPQVFRAPYYAPALNGIRSFYRSKNDPGVLKEARTDLQSIALDSKRANNNRVLNQFEKTSQYKRSLQPVSGPRISHTIGLVEIRLSPDLWAEEKGEARIIYYNCRNVPIDSAIAEAAIELGHWVLEENDQAIPLKAMEFVDLHSGQVHRASRRRASIVKAAKGNIKIIEALWNTI